MLNNGFITLWRDEISDRYEFLTYKAPRTWVFLYLVINANCTGKNVGKLKPDFQHIAQVFNCPYKKVWRWIKELSEEGYIEVDRGYGRSATVTIVDYNRFCGNENNLGTNVVSSHDTEEKTGSQDSEISEEKAPLKRKRKKEKEELSSSYSYLPNDLDTTLIESGDTSVSSETSTPKKVDEKLPRAAKKGRSNRKILKPTEADREYRKAEVTKIHNELKEIGRDLVEKFPDLDINITWMQTIWQNWVSWMAETYEFPNNYKMSFLKWVNSEALHWFQSRSNYQVYKKHNTNSSYQQNAPVNDGPTLDDYPVFE